MTTVAPTAGTPEQGASGSMLSPRAAQEPQPMPRRSALDLLQAQLAGIDLCAAAVRHLGSAGPLSREERMDRDRLRAVRERERDAVLAWTQRCLADSALPLEVAAPARAVIAHRQPWFRQKVAAGLEEQGVRVVAVLDDGADASGTVLAEQPEILLIEDRLSSLNGLAVVRRAHAYAPGTFVGVQVADTAPIGELLAAGAGSVFTRRVPPADVVVELTRCLVEQLPRT